MLIKTALVFNSLQNLWVHLRLEPKYLQSQHLWCEEPGYSHLPTACKWYVVVTAVFYMETWVFLGCRSTQCKLEKTRCRPTTVVPSTNHKISLCKLRRLVDKNLDAICELPVLLSLSSTLFLYLMWAWHSLSICKQKQVKPPSTSWQPGVLFQVENLSHLLWKL